MSLLELAVAFGAASLAAAINSVAGGGTLVSFPALVALGLPAVTANATSAVGIWPGSLGSIWGFRGELRRVDRRWKLLALPCLAGGGVGALLLRATTPAAFERAVPFLVGFATALFAFRGAVQRWLTQRLAVPSAAVSATVGSAAVFAVGVYGGYFGAGMSIMNLSVLGLLGLTELLEMNALTSLFSACVNGVAIVIFALAGLVRWDVAGAMSLGALVGGYGAVGLARRVGKQALGRFVVGVGCVVTAVFLLRLCTG